MLAGIFNKYFFSVVCFTILVRTANSQQYQYEIFNESDGVAHPFTYDIFQDSRGYLWIGTDNGISKFDGKTFRNYYKQHREINSNYILCINEFRGYLFVGTFGGGINIYNRFEDRFFAYKNKNIPTDIRRIYIYNDKIYMISRELELYEVDPINSTITDLSKKLKSFIYDFSIHNSNIYCSTKKGLFQLNPSFDLEKIDTISDVTCYKHICYGDTIIYTNDEGLWLAEKNKDPIMLKKYNFNNMVNGSLLLNKKNQLWFSTQDSLFTYELTKRKIISEIPKISTSNIYMDHEGNIWIASYGKGVYQVKNKSTIAYFTEYSGFSSKDMIVKKLEVNGDTVIVVHAKGTASLPFLKDKMYANYTPPPDFIMYDYIKTGSKEYYAVQKEGVSMVHDESGKVIFSTKESINTIKKSKKSNIFYIGVKKGVYLLNLDTKEYKKIMPDNRVLDITEYENRVYIGTNNGMFVLNEGEQPIRIMDDYINKIKITKNNIIIACTDNGIVFKRNNRSYRILNEENCQDIIGDNTNYLVATNNGLYNATKNGINKIEVIENNPNTPITALGLSSQSLYIGTTKGLYMAEVVTSCNDSSGIDQFIIPIYLEKIKSNDNEIGFQANTNIQLKPKQNNITFYFSYPYLSSISKTELMYRINQGEWVRTKDSKVTLSNLEHGTSLLEVKVINKNVSSKILSYNINVGYPLYLQPLFIVICSLVFVIASIIAAILIYRHRSKKTKRKHEEEMYTLELENQALFALINPHFIFNSLNNIKFFIQQNIKDLSIEYLNKLSKLIRLVLETADSKESSIQNEIILLENYLSIENLRFDIKVNYSIKVINIEETETTMIPSMIIQPFVENALWHAFDRTHTKPAIQILFEKATDKTILVSITDNGKGIHTGNKNIPKASIPLGISIIKRRLDVLNSIYNTKCKIVIKENDLHGSGTVIQIELPITHYLKTDQ